MKVLVTGATGGIGELVIAKLLSQKHHVIATSRDAEKAKQCHFYQQVNYLPYTIGENTQENLFAYFQKPDVLIHLAWDKLNDYKNEEHLTSILNQHKDFLENIIRNGLKNVTVIGTVYEYGLLEGELEESMPSNAIMPYPQAKNALRNYLDELKTKYTFSLKWMRVFYVFGSIKERRNLFTAMTQAIANKDELFNMSGGEQIRDFLSPEEIASNIVSAALQLQLKVLLTVVVQGQ